MDRMEVLVVVLVEVLVVVEVLLVVVEVLLETILKNRPPPWRGCSNLRQTPSGGGLRMMARSTAATHNTVSITGVKSLVTLYLLIDDQFKYPVAKIKSNADGSYDVTPSDVTSFLLNPPSGLASDYDFILPNEAAITSSSTDAEIILAFQALGPLQVRALYVKDNKPKIISAMADPSSTDPVRVDPMVSRAAQQLIGSLQKTIKTSLEAGASLTTDQKKSLLSGVLGAVKETVNNTLAEVETTFELPEGVTDASELESFLEVEIDATTLNAITNALDNDTANLGRTGRQRNGSGGFRKTQ